MINMGQRPADLVTADYDVNRTKSLLLMLAALISAGMAWGADADGYKLLKLDGHSVKWGAARMGTGATVTYSVARASSTAAGTENCRKTAGINSLLARSQVRTRGFEQALKDAFKLWSDVADIHFVPAPAGKNGDLVITAEAEPDGVAFSDVTPSTTHPGTVAQAIICLNPEAHWTEAHSSTPDSYRLFYVLAHEIGHTIGLDHPGPTGTLMSFEYSNSLETLEPGDIAGAISLYGTAQKSPLALNAR